MNTIQRNFHFPTQDEVDCSFLLSWTDQITVPIHKICFQSIAQFSNSLVWNPIYHVSIPNQNFFKCLVDVFVLLKPFFDVKSKLPIDFQKGVELRRVQEPHHNKLSRLHSSASFRVAHDAQLPKKVSRGHFILNFVERGPRRDQHV